MAALLELEDSVAELADQLRGRLERLYFAPDFLEVTMIVEFPDEGSRAVFGEIVQAAAGLRITSARTLVGVDEAKRAFELARAIPGAAGDGAPPPAAPSAEAGPAPVVVPPAADWSSSPVVVPRAADWSSSPAVVPPAADWSSSPAVVPPAAEWSSSPAAAGPAPAAAAAPGETYEVVAGQFGRFAELAPFVAGLEGLAGVIDVSTTQFVRGTVHLQVTYGGDVPLAVRLAELQAFEPDVRVVAPGRLEVAIRPPEGPEAATQNGTQTPEPAWAERLEAPAAPASQPVAQWEAAGADHALRPRPEAGDAVAASAREAGLATAVSAAGRRAAESALPAPNARRGRRGWLVAAAGLLLVFVLVGGAAAVRGLGGGPHDSPEGGSTTAASQMYRTAGEVASGALDLFTQDVIQPIRQGLGLAGPGRAGK